MSARAASGSGREPRGREVLRLAIEVEADHGLDPEFLLLGDEERRLHLVVGGVRVLPECVRGALPLLAGHLLPQTCRGQRRRLGHPSKSSSPCIRYATDTRAGYNCHSQGAADEAPTLDADADYMWNRGRRGMADERHRRGRHRRRGGSQRSGQGRHRHRPARNVILFIGDGMGDSEMTAARSYALGPAAASRSTRCR